MKTKSIKDAVHGYIQVDEPYWRAIDTAEFQRLKWLEQTSYRILYPSARHDRFIHSIGTYHLGQKAFEGFNENGSLMLGDKELISNYRNSFLLACLLHDVGHAPFSHTCEDLFNYQSKVADTNCKLNIELRNLAQQQLAEDEWKLFKKDYNAIITSATGKQKAPSEHEIMSAIVIIKNFATFTEGFADVEGEKPNLDLVIRSILGCVYGVKRSEAVKVRTEKGIKNCLIRLLNSSTVDVDKLDYIARDTLMSGYENVVLDNDRLLRSLSFIIKENVYYPAFNKSAISVIDNVVSAKNAQAKWIVNHPVVIYEYYLLRKSIGISFRNVFNEKFSDGQKLETFDDFLKKIFSSASLSRDENSVGELSFRLLSDIDILFYMKKNIEDENVAEFFERNKRKRAVWKSHEEYLYCLKGKDNACEIADFFVPLITHLGGIEDLYHPKRINQKLYDEIEGDTNIHSGEEMIKILDVLKGFCNKNNVEFDFVILPAKNKFFTKIDGDKTFIRFGAGKDEYITYKTLQNDNIQNLDRQYEFFYLYSKTNIDAKVFLEYVLNEAHSTTEVRC